MQIVNRARIEEIARPGADPIQGLLGGNTSEVHTARVSSDHAENNQNRSMDCMGTDCLFLDPICPSDGKA
jgi:hypothetical protein